MTSLANILNYQFLEHAVFKYLISFFILIFFIFLRSLFTRFVLTFLRKLTIKTTNTIDDKLLNALEEPLKYIFVLIGLYLAKEYFDPLIYDAFFHVFISSICIGIGFWILYRLVNEFDTNILLFSRNLSPDIANFITKAIKFIIVIFGILFILSDWGVDISTLVASFGLGGLAIALAAKDTVANLFGSLIIFTDRPFKLGDLVEIQGIKGRVEEIGIRSTRLRQSNQAVVSMPNSLMSNSSIINHSLALYFNWDFSLKISLSNDQAIVENFLNSIPEALTKIKSIQKESINVCMQNFEANHLNISIACLIKEKGKNLAKAKQAINIALFELIKTQEIKLA